MKTALTVLGVCMVIAGIIWVGQGTGYFPYPASSFMIDDMTWTYIGAATAVVGAGIIYFARCRKA
jgi:hypothetical protein